MKRTLSLLSIKKIAVLATCLQLTLSTQAALVAHFKLDEGAADAGTGTVASTVGGYHGTLTGLGQLPAPVSS